MPTRRSLGPPAFVLGLVLAVSPGCTTASSSSRYFGRTDPPAGQNLRYVSGSEPESLDPEVSDGQPEGRIDMALYEGLTEIDPKTAQPIPAIASSWEPNGDNTVFTFHLRPEARWSDGTPITSADFVYSFRRGLSPALASRSAYLAFDIVNAEDYNSGKAPAESVGVDAVDAHTLRIRLRRPAPFLPGLLTNQFFKPVPRQAVEQYGDGWTKPGHLVASGPFMLKTWRPYDRLVVVRNPEYWDAVHVRLESITFFPLEDQTTIMNLYEAGDIDAFLNHTVPAGWIESLRHYGDYMDAPELTNTYVCLNTTRPPMNDLRVRQAFNAAIDKVGLAQYLHSAKPLFTFLPDELFQGYPPVRGEPFDPAHARALLAEAGYHDANGQYDPSRFPIDQVEYLYNTVDVNRQVGEFLQAQWKQNLGLTVPLKNAEWRTFLQTRADLDYRGMARGAWVGDYVDPFTFLNLFSTLGAENCTGWSDATYQQMLSDANREPDRERRYALLGRAEQYLLDHQPVLPLLTQSTNFMRKPYVKGLYANALTMHAWKYVYIEHDPAKWDEPAVETGS
jgi:oligopeptide transport system substrate-binding protein